MYNVHIRLNFSSTFLLEYSGCAFAAYLQCRGLLCWPLVSYSDSRRDMIPLCRDHNCSRIYHPLIPLLADLNYFSSLLLSPFLTLHLSLSYSTDIKKSEYPNKNRAGQVWSLCSSGTMGRLGFCAEIRLFCVTVYIPIYSMIGFLHVLMYSSIVLSCSTAQ